MKKVVFLLASFLLIGVCAINAQDVLKFKTFDFLKGSVSVDNDRYYDSFTFTIKHKNKSRDIVSTVSVGGRDLEFSIEFDKSNSVYTVLIPKGKGFKVGDEFDVTINFVYEGKLAPSFLSALATGSVANCIADLSGRTFLSPFIVKPDTGGPGGPGGGGDPTVIIVKYP